MKHIVLLLVLCSLAQSTVSAQSNFFQVWEARVRVTSAKQPAWPVPVVGSSSTIVQLALPTSSVPQIGRTIQWNTVAQYKVGKYLWPELEANASYYHGGTNNGKNQVFLTPALMVSKIKLRKDPKDRLGLVLGGGMQIATSSYHSYNHGLVLTGRIVF